MPIGGMAPERAALRNRKHPNRAAHLPERGVKKRLLNCAALSNEAP